jgi:CubicO group peptidase (beta-lactamase class C family)
MLVAGKVIEIASGTDYFEYVRTRITRPGGMTSTDSYDLDRVNRNLAVGYDPIPGSDPTEYRNNLFMHVVRGGPAGGGFSTVDDLWRFAKALRGGRSSARRWCVHSRPPSRRSQRRLSRDQLSTRHRPARRLRGSRAVELFGQRAGQGEGTMPDLERRRRFGAVTRRRNPLTGLS